MGINATSKTDSLNTTTHLKQEQVTNIPSHINTTINAINRDFKTVRPPGPLDNIDPILDKSNKVNPKPINLVNSKASDPIRLKKNLPIDYPKNDHSKNNLINPRR